MSFEDTNVLLGQRLRQRRKLLGLSQVDFSRQLGITFQQLQKYENGQNRISAASLFELCRANDIDIATLYREVTDAEPGSIGSIDADLEKLISSYTKIADPRLRKTIRDLVQTMAKEASVF